MAIVSLLLLGGCASDNIPPGPSVAVMPAPGKPFEVFAAEDRECRQYAQMSVGKTPSQAASETQGKSILFGTAVGAAAGAMTGRGENVGTGAAVGGVTGAAVGAGAGRESAREVQRRYDIAYEQCMYAKGNQLPSGSYYQPTVIYQQPYAPPPSAPPPSSYPPPNYPPPPPR